MNKLICSVISVFLFVSISLFPSIALAEKSCEVKCCATEKCATEKCRYCSRYCPVLGCWSKCKNPQKVIGTYNYTWNRYEYVGEIPLCAAEHKDEKYYKNIWIKNDTDHEVTVRVYYFGFNHTKRVLKPNDIYLFKYDKTAMIWHKYIKVDNCKKKKINSIQKEVLVSQVI